MSSITKNWTEADFRRELRKIDEHVKKKYGLDLMGGELEIALSERSSCVLGSYSPREKKFRFSLPFFNKDVPEESAVGVIKHEYAHYLTDVLYGSCAHNGEFKAACQMVDTNPNTTYSKLHEKYARKREERKAKIYNSRVFVGQTVTHPKYGKGTVVYVKANNDSALLTVEFPDVGTKTIDELWLREHGNIKR